MTDESKPQEQQTDPDAAYASAWEEFGQEEQSAEQRDATPGDGAGQEADETPPSDEQKQTKGEEPPLVSEHHGSMQSMEKALTDTKAHATKLSQELADVKKQLEAARQQGQNQGDTPAQLQERFQKIREKAPLDDYPELEPFVDLLIKESQSIAQEVEQLRSEKAIQSAQSEALQNFEANIKPHIVKVHPDFDQVVRDNGYFEWAEKQRPALRFAAMQSDDPNDINWALTEFKKHRGADEITARKEKTAQDRQTKVDMARSLRGGANPDLAKTSGDREVYDWDWAGRELAKEQL
jgi:hypothetical protein